MSESRQWLPEDLELMSPGPELAAALASVDREALSSKDRVRLLQARSRMAAHVQGEMYADLYAISRAEPPGVPDERDRQDVMEEPYPWASTEISFALRWTYTAASVRLDLARRMIEDLPMVQTALAAGDIDVPKALVLCDEVACLELPMARRIVGRLILKAPELTTGQLRAKLRRLVLAANPQAAGAAAKARLKGRAVVISQDHHNLASISGFDLLPHRVAASYERLTAMARAARAAGDSRKMDELRADAMLDLLIGEGSALGGPITFGGLDTSSGDTSPPAPPNTIAPIHAKSATAPAAAGTATAGIVAAGTATAGNAAVGNAAVGNAAVGAGAAGIVSVGSVAAGAAVTGASVAGAATAGTQTVSAPGVHCGSGPVRARDTVPGFCDADAPWPLAPADPSLLDAAADPPTKSAGPPDITGAGTGTLPMEPPAEVAGDPAIDPEHEMLRPYWLAGFDQLATARPPASARCPQTISERGPMPAPRRGVVDLQMSLTTLMGLDDLPAELSGFGPLLADIGRQVVEQRPDLQLRFSVYNELDSLIAHGVTRQRPPARARPPVPERQDHSGHSAARRRTGRRPTAEVAALVRARNRTCSAPGCRIPSLRCELDHVLAWAHQGESEPDNLDPVCTRHHTFKHSPGAQLVAFSPGTFGWQTPLGMQYLSRPDPPLYDDHRYIHPPLPGDT